MILEATSLPLNGVNQDSHPLLSVLAALFLQQCHFLRQAGHSEKAVALFQAMVDFTFFKPDSVKELPTKGQVRTLSTPSTPRPALGEVGLVGGGPSVFKIAHPPLSVLLRIVSQESDDLRKISKQK